jgi:hypothetical protein
MDMDTDFKLELELFYKISIQRHSPYRSVWTTLDVPRCKFWRRYELVASLPDDYFHTTCSPNDLLAELEISVWG